MRLVAFLLGRSRAVMLLAVVAGAAGGACGVALIGLIHRELDGAWPPGPGVAWAFVGLLALATSLRFASQAAMARLGQDAVAALRVKLARQILTLPLERFERSDPGGLFTALTEDIAVIAGALAGVPLFCINGPIVLACVLYLGWLSPAILACGVIVAAPAIGLHLALASAGLLRFQAAREAQDVLTGHLRAVVDGFRELKQHRPRREGFLALGLGPAAERVRRRGATGLVLFAAAQGCGQLAFFGFLGALAFVLPALWPIPRATIAGAALVTLYVMGPLDVLVNGLPLLARALASLRKVEALIPSLAALGREDRPRGAVAAPAFRESIRLDGVTYAYPPDPDGSGGFCLGPVDLTLRPGEAVFLVGGNGSGKTTLVKLVAGLYDPQEGALLVDGRPVGDEAREAYRQLVSVVFADGFLFGALFGLDPAGLDARTRVGLERLGLGGRVTVDSGAFSTTALSQGQRRRLALLAALLEDRPVCVFDEWAANQDPHAKRLFYRELIPELKARGKALLVITHDEDYHDLADRVLRLRDGLAADEAPVAVEGACP